MSTQRVDICQASDLPELFERFAEWYRFNPRMRERDYFDWQFRDAPTRLADGEFDFLLLRENDEIVGCLGFTGFEFRLDGGINIGGWTHNWYAPDRRDGGLALMFRFMELVDNRFIFRFNENTARVFSLLRVPMIAAVPRWWAVTDADHAADLFQLEASDRAAVSRSAASMERIDGTARIHSVNRFDPDEEFTLTHLAEGLNGARRTGKYLNWRYLDIPRHRYHAIRGDRGMGIYRVEIIMNHDVSVIRIVEWTFDDGECGAALATLLRDHNDAKPIMLDFHCASRLPARSLERFGFTTQSATTKPMPDLFRPMNYSGGHALALDFPPHRTTRAIDFDRWYITAGDSDVDRVKL
jgi:hypothetical protein